MRLLVAVGPDLRYLTGYEAMPLERLTMLVVIPGQPPTIVVPRLERGAAEAGLADRRSTIVTWDERRDPYEVVTGLLLGPVGHARPRIAVSDTLWASHLLRAAGEALPGAPGSSRRPPSCATSG